MKKVILWLFVLLVLVFSVSSGTGLYLNNLEPESNQTLTSTTVNFKCDVGTDESTQVLVKYKKEVWSSWSETNIKMITSSSQVEFSEGLSTGNWLWMCNASTSTESLEEDPYSFIIYVNDPPVITPSIPNQNKSLGTESWFLDLSSYKFDEDPSTCIWSVSGIDTSILNVTISNDMVTFNRITSSIGSDTITFTLADSENLTDTQDIIVYFYETSGSPTSETDCSDNVDNDGDGLFDCQDSDCTSSPNNCQDAVCNSTSYDWEYTIKSSADCDEDSDCDSDEECDLTDCDCVAEDTSSSSSDDDDSDEDESGLFIIKSHTPSSDKVNLNIGDSKTFKITSSGDTVVKWYLDEEKVGDDSSYVFKPDKEGTYELVAVIGSGASLKKNDDFYLWTVTVGEEDILASNICGNDKVDSGENCENCARDVKCAEGEKCVNKECVKSTAFFSKVSGYAVKTKDFVVEKWKYSSIIGGIIVVLVIVGLIYAGKKGKDDVLSEFGKEGFFSKVGKVFKRGKKGYVTKKVEKPVVEKQREVYIDKQPFDDKKL